MARLPSVGEVSYNGYTFPSPLSARISAVPFLTQDQRSVKYVEYTISVEAIILPTDEIDGVESVLFPNSTLDNLEDIRKKLQQQGQTLRFKGQGFGTLVANNFALQAGETFTQDVNNGPIPELLVWEPVGSNQAVRVVWRVRTYLLECDVFSVSLASNNIVDLSYGATFSINQEGLTERTITGRIEIAATRDSNNKFLLSADNFRENIIIEPILAFKRAQNYVLSADKKVLDFTVIDTEIPSDNAFAPGMVDMSVSHRVSSKLKTQGFNVWSNTISGTITTAPGTSRHLPWLAFLDIVKSRTDRASLSREIFTNSEGKRTSLPARWIPTAVSITEPIFGRTFSFSFQYLLLVDPGQILTGSGLFQGIPGSWVAHRRSLLDSVSNVRGAAGLIQQQTDSGDLSCGFNSKLELRTRSVPPIAPVVVRTVFNVLCPPPEESWLQYHLWVDVNNKNNVYVHSRSNAPPDTDVKEAKKAAISGENAITFDIEVFKDVDKYKPIVQTRGPSVGVITIRGWAVRLGYPINIPVVEKIGTILARPIGTDAVTNRLLWAGKCPIYVATWRKQYTIDTQLPGKRIISKIQWANVPKQYIP